MTLWNTLQDVNLASQPPINFRSDNFGQNMLHIYSFYFEVLDASLIEHKTSIFDPMLARDPPLLVKQLAKN